MPLLPRLKHANSEIAVRGYILHLRSAFGLAADAQHLAPLWIEYVLNLRRVLPFPPTRLKLLSDQKGQTKTMRLSAPG